VLGPLTCLCVPKAVRLPQLVKGCHVRLDCTYCSMHVLRCVPCQLKHLMRAGCLLPPTAAHPTQGLQGVRKTVAVSIFPSMS
jgi:hypothetical protein